MVFDLNNKVALITGGASGLGLKYAKELLANGVRGVTLADINPQYGAAAVKEINSLFGPNKAVFITTDVTKSEQVEAAFLETIKSFKNIDILINNAGILNDAIWEKEILININGTVHGILLGLEKYLPKYKQGEEAVIVNISSTAGTQGYDFVPVYCATKHAILGLMKGWATPEYYQETKVRMIALCPGPTDTPLISEISGRNLGERYQRHFSNLMGSDMLATQDPDHVAKEAIRVIKYAPHGTSWVIDNGEPAYQYIVPDRSTMKNNILKME